MGGPTQRQTVNRGMHIQWELGDGEWQNQLSVFHEKQLIAWVTVIFLMAFVSWKSHIFLKKEKTLEGQFALSIIKNTWLQKKWASEASSPRESFSRILAKQSYSILLREELKMLPAPFLHFMTAFSRFLQINFTFVFSGICQDPQVATIIYGRAPKNNISQ